MEGEASFSNRSSKDRRISRHGVSEAVLPFVYLPTADGKGRRSIDGWSVSSV